MLSSSLSALEPAVCPKCYSGFRAPSGAEKGARREERLLVEFLKKILFKLGKSFLPTPLPRRGQAKRYRHSDGPLLPVKERITKNIQRRPRQPSKAPDKRGGAEEASPQGRSGDRQLSRESSLSPYPRRTTSPSAGGYLV